MPKRSSRRDFLKGKSAADALAARAGSLTPGDKTPPRPTNDDPCLLQVSREAMACTFEVFLNAGQYEQGTEAALAALDQVDRVEQQLSVFRESSDISRINRLAAEEPVEIDDELFTLLEETVRLHDQTDGAFDVTAGPLSDVWGFSRRSGRVPTPDELAEASARVGTRRLELDARQRTVRFAVPGMKLNLGSIGKGYALDRCAEALLDAGVADFMIHGGQSSVIAQGNLGHTLRTGMEQHHKKDESIQEPCLGWAVGVPHPLGQRPRLAEVRLRDRALATSGSQRQFFYHQGRRLSHLLDPRTGWPAESRILSTTVLAPTAMEADALATAMFVLGPEPALEFCRRRADLCLLLVLSTKTTAVEILTCGLTPDDLEIP
ncbi:MAG: FAD:protein FMN transferase [Pirellulales bacterium]|nr:FAD:protein FMN transferase [Pirellulales bacterium]